MITILLHNKFKELTAKRSLTIQDVMKSTGVSRASLSNIANNKHATISNKTLSLICQALDVDPGEFYEWDSDIETAIKQLRR